VEQQHRAGVLYGDIKKSSTVVVGDGVIEVNPGANIRTMGDIFPNLRFHGSC
jgi:hypothetical protein